MYSTGIVFLSYLLALVATQILSGVFRIDFLGYLLSPYLDESIYVIAFTVLLLINYISTWSLLYGRILYFREETG